jgi:hypothetical protein
MEWLFGIVGGIAVFLGIFILAAGEDQYVGIGGDLSWRVGDISSAWAYGLLIGGGALFLIALGMFIAASRSERAVRTSNRALSDLLMHVGVFVVVNAFIWIQDIALGEGLDYAYWVTIPWGLGLAAHATTYYFTRGAEQSAADDMVGRKQGVPEKDEPKELSPH